MGRTIDRRGNAWIRGSILFKYVQHFEPSGLYDITKRMHLRVLKRIRIVAHSSPHSRAIVISPTAVNIPLRD